MEKKSVADAVAASFIALPHDQKLAQKEKLTNGPSFKVRSVKNALSASRPRTKWRLVWQIKTRLSNEAVTM